MVNVIKRDDGLEGKSAAGVCHGGIFPPHGTGGNRSSTRGLDGLYLRAWSNLMRRATPAIPARNNIDGTTTPDMYRGGPVREHAQYPWYTMVVSTASNIANPVTTF